MDDINEPIDFVIPVDYTSLHPQSFEFQGANLSQAEVSKCKEGCRRSNKTKEMRRYMITTQGRGQQRDVTGVSKYEYTVEFPLDEEEGNIGSSGRMDMEVENSLVMEVANSLNLKGGRDCFEGLHDGQGSGKDLALTQQGKSRKEEFVEWAGKRMRLAQEKLLLL